MYVLLQTFLYPRHRAGTTHSKWNGEIELTQRAALVGHAKSAALRRTRICCEQQSHLLVRWLVGWGFYSYVYVVTPPGPKVPHANDRDRESAWNRSGFSSTQRDAFSASRCSGRWYSTHNSVRWRISCTSHTHTQFSPD